MVSGAESANDCMREDSRTSIKPPAEQNCGDSGDRGESGPEEANVDIPCAFKKYFSLLPTKADLQGMFSKMEVVHKADMQEIKAGLQNRLDQVEVMVPPVRLAIAELQTAVATQQSIIQALYKNVKDIEKKELIDRR